MEISFFFLYLLFQFHDFVFSFSSVAFFCVWHTEDVEDWREIEMEL